MTAAELRALLTEAGLSGAEVVEADDLYVKLPSGDFYLVAQSDPQRTIKRVLDFCCEQYAAFAHTLGLPTCTDVRALQEAARLAREALEATTQTEFGCHVTALAALAALREVLR